MKTVSIVLLLVAGSLTVHATPTLIGSNATVNYIYPDSTTVLVSQAVAVTSGVEVTCAGGFAGSALCSEFAGATTIDIGATTITLNEAASSSYTASAFNGLQFANLNFGDGSTVTGFALSTDLPGLTAADISFTGNSIEYNAEGLSFANAPYTITLDLTTTTSGSSSTPEPASVGLFGLAATAFGLWNIRSRRRAGL